MNVDHRYVLRLIVLERRSKCRHRASPLDFEDRRAAHHQHFVVQAWRREKQSYTQQKTIGKNEQVLDYIPTAHLFLLALALALYVARQHNTRALNCSQNAGHQVLPTSALQEICSAPRLSYHKSRPKKHKTEHNASPQMVENLTSPEEDPKVDVTGESERLLVTSWRRTTATRNAVACA
jgi:hypothetical protein